jgi:hypothetical protein
VILLIEALILDSLMILMMELELVVELQMQAFEIVILL